MAIYFAIGGTVLDAVWDLCRYTVNAGSLDTYTDSNTRERKPYEADWIIAATARLLVLWARHSNAYVVGFAPTWPVEWKQISAFLLWHLIARLHGHGNDPVAIYIKVDEFCIKLMDFAFTMMKFQCKRPDLAVAFQQQAHDRTMINYKDSTGLLRTSNTHVGRHIVDWMPAGGERDETVQRGEYTESNYTSVSNGFGAHGLELLAEMLRVAGHANATIVTAEAAGLSNRQADVERHILL